MKANVDEDFAISNNYWITCMGKLVEFLQICRICHIPSNNMTKRSQGSKVISPIL